MRSKSRRTAEALRPLRRAAPRQRISQARPPFVSSLIAHAPCFVSFLIDSPLWPVRRPVSSDVPPDPAALPVASLPCRQDATGKVMPDGLFIGFSQGIQGVESWDWLKV